MEFILEVYNGLELTLQMVLPESGLPAVPQAGEGIQVVGTDGVENLVVRERRFILGARSGQEGFTIMLDCEPDPMQGKWRAYWMANRRS